MIEKLKGINLCGITIGNIPTSFKDSLTYEEQILWICNYINTVVVPTVNEYVDKINNYEVNFDEINEAILLIKNDIATINYNLVEFYNRISGETNQKLTEYNNNIIRLMNDYQIIFNNSLNNLKIELENEIREIELGNVIAYDPTTGEYENVSTVIQNVYDSLRQNSISASEFDSLELTCTEFEAYDISAYNFDLNAKVILV